MIIVDIPRIILSIANSWRWSQWWNFWVEQQFFCYFFKARDGFPIPIKIKVVGKFSLNFFPHGGQKEFLSCFLSLNANNCLKKAFASWVQMSLQVVSMENWSFHRYIIPERVDWDTEKRIETSSLAGVCPSGCFPLALSFSFLELWHCADQY